MELEVRGICFTKDMMDSAHEMDALFGGDLKARAKREPAFEKIGELFLQATPDNPLSGPPDKRRSYSKKYDLYSVSQPIDYMAWAKADWAGRTDAYAQALTLAVQRVAKTRLTDAERETLISLVDQTRRQVREAPPQTVHPVGPTYVTYDENDKVVSLGFEEDGLGLSLGRVVALAPEEVAKLSRDDIFPPSPEEIPSFKLYRRIEGRLHYHEAWPWESKIVEHWGLCGTTGEVREHDFDGTLAGKRLIARLKKEARAGGFQSIAPSRHATLIVEYPIDGFGTPADIDRRHKIEDHMNHVTGWLGLGHCDGGSSGSGTMEVFCIVVDFALAKAALERELRDSPFAGFGRIYRME